MAIRIEPISIGLLVVGVQEGAKSQEKKKKKIVVPALATHYATGGGWLVFVGVDFRWSRLFCTF